jgi:hypothetical protein
MLDLERAIGLEAMVLVEEGRLAAEYEDEAIRTVLPIVLDRHLMALDRHTSTTVISFDITGRYSRDHYAELIVAMACACPWWLPGEERQDASHPGQQDKQRRAHVRRGPETMPTKEFVAALWKDSAWVPVERVKLAFRYYTRFCPSPENLDLDLVHESDRWSISYRELSYDRTLDCPQVSAIRAALLRHGSVTPDQLRSAVGYFERFKRDPKVSEDKLVHESALWGIDDNNKGRPYTGRDTLDCPQVSAIRAALLEYGAVTPFLLRQATSHHANGRRSVSESARLAVQGHDIPWHLKNRYWTPE